MIFKVSVIMSVYNGESYLRAAIESILTQTFTNFEFIIVDDGSTDSTLEIISEYVSKDSRIKLFKNVENIGLTKSLNRGLKLAKGEYIARQDADDLSLSKRFEKQVELLDKYSNIVLSSCNVEVIDAEGNYVSRHDQACLPEFVAWYLLFYNHVAGHSQVMFRRKPVVDLGGYCESRRYSQDYELWCRLAKVGSIAIIPEVLQKQRIHGKSISTEKRKEQRNYSLLQSQNNIQKLIGKELSLQEVSDLRQFWTGQRWWSHFPRSRSVGSLHWRLQEIHQAFSQQYSQQISTNVDISQQIHVLIRQQFIVWIEDLNKQQKRFAKLIVSLYAFAWYPSGVLSNWFKSW